MSVYDTIYDNIKNYILNIDDKDETFTVEKFYTTIQSQLDLLPKGKGSYIICSNSNGLGDQILAQSFIRELSKCYPSHKIIYITEEDYYDIWEKNPYIDILLKSNWNNKPFKQYLIQNLDLCKKYLWKFNIDYAFKFLYADFGMVEISMNWLANAKKRIGYGENALSTSVENNFNFDSYLINERVYPPKTSPLCT